MLISRASSNAVLLAGSARSHDLHTPVPGAALDCRVGFTWPCGTETARAEARGVDMEIRDKGQADGGRAVLGERLVGRDASDAVGVTFYRHAPVGMTGEHSGHVGQCRS